jgi:D-glycero-alpha-D-manno-heptose-7-phosphate kinase
MTPYELAYAAWRVETERLGLQSGIQDQLCAAHGGINWIQIPAYPQASVTRLALPERGRSAFGNRLVLVYLGKAHQSSQVHEMVIRQLEQAGSEAAALQMLRENARLGREALARGDLEAFGQAMSANHEAQRKLHPAMINPLTDQLVAIAKRFGAAGWKTNGAGGDGGSVTVLGSLDSLARRALVGAIRQGLPGVRVIPIALADQGVNVEVTRP